eukprot:217967-Heterocapsa_arctica.AAC.1
MSGGPGAKRQAEPERKGAARRTKIQHPTTRRRRRKAASRRKWLGSAAGNPLDGLRGPDRRARVEEHRTP